MNNKVYVWDLFVRFFHWTLVLAFTIAYFTGDEESSLHAYIGYYILALIISRVIWGLIGSRYARFSSFIYRPSAAIDYLKGFIGSGTGKKYTGHNPAGGWMTVALLISLLLTGLSGLKVYGIEGYGPLAENSTTLLNHQNSALLRVSSADSDENEREEEYWEEIHEFLANFTVFLIFLHIGGVFASSLKQRQNLAKSMLTGYKKDEP
ncbi:Cytochrome b [hydrothermal vent metagenome]|uniref:Cytochrome b n=1 Tax=hydrothermal vent metagenome TaxID=652676 RepID=A0A3B1AF97_9ZZZZ